MENEKLDLVNETTEGICKIILDYVENHIKEKYDVPFTPRRFPGGRVPDYEPNRTTREALHDKIKTIINGAVENPLKAEKCKENLQKALGFGGEIINVGEIELNSFWNDATAVGLVVIDNDHLLGNILAWPMDRRHRGICFTYIDRYFKLTAEEPIPIVFGRTWENQPFTKFEGLGREGTDIYFADGCGRHSMGWGAGHLHPAQEGFSKDCIDKVIATYTKMMEKIQK